MIRIEPGGSSTPGGEALEISAAGKSGRRYIIAAPPFTSRVTPVM